MTNLIGRMFGVSCNNETCRSVEQELIWGQRFFAFEFLYQPFVSCQFLVGYCLIFYVTPLRDKIYKKMSLSYVFLCSTIMEIHCQLPMCLEWKFQKCWLKTVVDGRVNRDSILVFEVCVSDIFELHARRVRKVEYILFLYLLHTYNSLCMNNEP